MKKVVLFLAIVSFSSVAGITDITTKPVALIALKKNSAQYVDVCKAADDSCKEGTSIWKEKNADGIFYLTTSHLQLTKLKKDGDTYSKIYSWPAFTDKASTKVSINESVAYPFQSQPQHNK